MSLTEFLGRRCRAALLILGVALVLLVYMGDRLTGPEFEVSIFYIIPVSFFAWFVHRWAGIAAAAVSATMFLSVNRAARELQGHRSTTYWNGLAWLSLYVFIVLIVSELKHLYGRERERALTDEVTEIPNRRAFFEHLTAETNRARRYGFPMTVAYIDLDRFKSINDRLGHATGDKLLACVAITTCENIRHSDLVARIGGDEFAVLLPQTDMQASAVVLANVEQQLADAMRVNEWDVGFSIGAVTFRPPPESVQEVVSQADQVMYSVKASGQSGVRQKEVAA